MGIHQIEKTDSDTFEQNEMFRKRFSFSVEEHWQTRRQQACEWAKVNTRCVRLFFLNPRIASSSDETSKQRQQATQEVFSVLALFPELFFSRTDETHKQSKRVLILFPIVFLQVNTRNTRIAFADIQSWSIDCSVLHESRKEAMQYFLPSFMNQWICSFSLFLSFNTQTTPSTQSIQCRTVTQSLSYLGHF